VKYPDDDDDDATVEDDNVVDDGALSSCGSGLRSAMMDACSSLLAAPSYGFGASGAFEACTPPPAPSEAARRALLSGWPNYHPPAVSADPSPSMFGHRAPPTFSPYTPAVSGVAAPPYGSPFADIAAFGPPPPPPPQRSNLSAFYSAGASSAGNGAGCGGTVGDAYSAAAYPHPHHQPSQHPGQQQHQGSAQHHVHPAASSAAVAAALHGSRLLLSDLQTAAAAVGAMPPPSLTNSRYDSVDPLCYLNDVVTGSSAHNSGIHNTHCMHIPVYR